MAVLKAVASYLLILAAAGISQAARAAAPPAELAAVHGLLAPWRAHGQAPDVIAARRMLDAWIDARVARVPRTHSSTDVAAALNGAIAAADLACRPAGAPQAGRCANADNIDARGFLGIVGVERIGELLLVRSEIGVACGFDQAAALYRWRDGWRRLFTDARETVEMSPRAIEQIIFTRADKQVGGWLLVATGAESPCTQRTGKTRGPIQYALWHVSPDGPQRLLAEERMDDVPEGRRPAISARFERTDLLVEFDARSLDAGVPARVAVRKYRIEGTRARRIAPFALTPRDFVEEWLSVPWSAASPWSDASARAALEARHAAMRGAAPASGLFVATTRRCPNDIFEVAVALRTGESFFRMHRPDADTFSMRAVASSPDPACTPDPTLDLRRTLFP